jgi:DNA-binding CsgD family transcriptional regulator
MRPPEAGLRLLRLIALVSIFVGGTLDLIPEQAPGLLPFPIVDELFDGRRRRRAGADAVVGLVAGRLRSPGVEPAARGPEGRERRLEGNGADALLGLGEAIAAKFDEWQLTPAEREVALLLLKGYSHKHVARVTGRSERTARQHAQSVYQKAGRRNRAELAAYFLEDLILPEDSRILVSSDGAGQ